MSGYTGNIFASESGSKGGALRGGRRRSGPLPSKKKKDGQVSFTLLDTSKQTSRRMSDVTQKTNASSINRAAQRLFGVQSFLE